MEKLLLLVHRIPYPPNKGDKIHSFHLLTHLSKHYRVYFGTFVDDEDDWQHVPRMQALCTESYFARLSPIKARLRSIGALLGKRPLSLDFYNDRGLTSWVGDIMRRHKIDRVLSISAVMAQYAQPYPQARRLVDFGDVDSQKWREYAEKKSWPMSWVYAYEARELLRYERAVTQQFDATLFVSQPEVELFQRLAPESAHKIGLFSNGVDTAYFSPEHDFPNPYTKGEAAIVFTGAMNYWPNVDAVQWFATSVLPRIREAFPAAHFVIVGSRPSPEVQALAALDGITVTGTVDDVRPFIRHAALAVAPLRIARGLQNKVLEAMAMAKCVVVSPQALEGIDAQVGRDLILAPDADGFVASILALLRQPDPALCAAARVQVQQHYSWASNLARIDAWIENKTIPETAAAKSIVEPITP